MHTATSSSAAQAQGFVQGRFAAMRQALDAKEKEVVQAIKQHSEAKLKALDLHREQLVTMQHCVRTMVQQCGGLVGGDGDKVSALTRDFIPITLCSNVFFCECTLSGERSCRVCE
jgi:hypothetical protein